MFRSVSSFVFLASFIVALGQTQTPSFEVASVKANKSGEVRMSVDMQGGGRLDMHNVSMKTMIMMAYHSRPEAVTGGPDWSESDRFDVVAKAAQTTPPDDLRRMLQSLLAERFELAVHMDAKLMPAYALVLAKSGPKLHPSEAAILTDQRCVPGPGEPGQKHIVCRHIPIAMFGDLLQEQSPRDFAVPVVDQTGLQGSFDFKLDWVPTTRTATADPPAGPTIMEAIETQLGLKLESRKLPLPVIVIDRVKRLPSDN